MLEKRFLKEAGISQKDFATVFVLLFNALTWYFIQQVLINSMLKAPEIAQLRTYVLSAYLIAIIIAGLVGAIISTKFKQNTFLFSWILLGTFSSLLPALFRSTSVESITFFSVFLGLSFGLGMPLTLAYFAAHTTFENRGRMGGILFLVTNFSTLPIAIATLNFDSTITSVTASAWRGLGFILFLLLKPKELGVETTKARTSFVTILRDKHFLLYLVPWLMFTLVNGLEQTILQLSFGNDFYNFMLMLEPISGGIFAFIGGFFADKIGRKRVIVTGFAALGLAYAILGMAPEVPIARYLFVAIDGAAAGIFIVSLFLIVWGDLASQATTAEKHYVIGSIPHFLSGLMGLTLSPYVALIPANAAFSLAAFFLFLAVLPLMYAPETLPEKKIELRRLKGYVEQAKKVRDKYLKHDS